MELLTRISNGVVETSSGSVAICPKSASGEIDGQKYFEFRTSPLSAKIHVRWPIDAPVIVVDADIARVMIQSGYAVGPSDEQVKAFNEQVHEALEAYKAEQEKAEQEKAAADKAAADKAAADKAAADKAAADKAAADKAANKG